MGADARELLLAFGSGVRRLRVERGMSQEQLAELAGLNRTYLGDVERGERNVSLINIHRIARALDVPTGELMATLDAVGGH